MSRKSKTIYGVKITLDPSVVEQGLGGGKVDDPFGQGIRLVRTVLRKRPFSNTFRGFDLPGSRQGPTLNTYFPSQRTGNRALLIELDTALRKEFEKTLGVHYGTMEREVLRLEDSTQKRRRSRVLGTRTGKLELLATLKQDTASTERWEDEYRAALPYL